MINKDKAVLEWLRGNDALRSLPLFGFMQNDVFSSCVVPMPSAAAQVEYMDGSRRKQYSFMLRLQVPLSQTYDEVNTEAMAMMRDWMAWLEAQEEAENYPDFGGGVYDYEVRVGANMPSVALAHADSGRAVLQLPAVIGYSE